MVAAVLKAEWSARIDSKGMSVICCSVKFQGVTKAFYVSSFKNAYSKDVHFFCHTKACFFQMKIYKGIFPKCLHIKPIFAAHCEYEKNEESFVHITPARTDTQSKF